MPTNFKFYNQEKNNKKGSVKVITKNGKYDIVLKRTLTELIRCGYVVAVV